MLMTHQQSAELAQPGVGAFDDPTPPVAAQFAPIFVAPAPIVLPVRRDQLDAAFLQSFTQRIGIVGGVGNHPFRLLPGTALAPRNRNFGERGLRKCNFVRSGTFQPNSQRKTLTVDQYHPLRPLAPLALPTAEPLFSPEQSCHPGRSPPTSTALLHPAPPAACAPHSADRLRLPTPASAASRP